MKRGEIWWVSLGVPTGSEPGFRRPVLIVQSNAFNRSNIATVTVATITSNLALEAAPGNLRLSQSASGLKKPSVINVSQLATIDKSRLSGKVGTVPAKIMQRVDHGLRLVLGLGAAT